MTKEQWAYMVKVMKLKWPNFHWTDEQVISAYGDLKGIDPKFVEKSIEQYFKGGNDFAPNPSNIYSTAMEIMRYDMSDRDEQLPAPEYSDYTLNRWLQENNYESVAHAMYNFARKRFLNGTSWKCETFDYSEPWEKSKESYLQTFGGGIGRLTRVIRDIDKVEEG